MVVCFFLSCSVRFFLDKNRTMITKGCQRHYSFLQPPKFTGSLTSGTLSPDTITTTSSGYSTGGSSVSTTIVPSSVDLNQQKTKPKGKE
jgi:hypothetical protein